MTQGMQHEQSHGEAERPLSPLEVVHELTLELTEKKVTRRTTRHQPHQKCQHEGVTHFDLLRLPRLGESENDMCRIAELQARVPRQSHILHSQVHQLRVAKVTVKTEQDGSCHRPEARMHKSIILRALFFNKVVEFIDL